MDEKKDSVKAVFFYFVMKRDALRRNGGLDAKVMASHPNAQTTSGLVMVCAMSAQEIDAIVDDLKLLGLEDSDCYLGVWDGLETIGDQTDAPRLVRPWLEAKVEAGELWFRCIDP